MLDIRLYLNSDICIFINNNSNIFIVQYIICMFLILSLQKQCIDFTINAKPLSKFMPRDKESVKYRVWQLVVSQPFDNFIMAMIVFNTLILMMKVCEYLSYIIWLYIYYIIEHTTPKTKTLKFKRAQRWKSDKITPRFWCDICPMGSCFIEDKTMLLTFLSEGSNRAPLNFTSVWSCRRLSADSISMEWT